MALDILKRLSFFVEGTFAESLADQWPSMVHFLSVVVMAPSSRAPTLHDLRVASIVLQQCIQIRPTSLRHVRSSLQISGFYAIGKI